MPDIDALIARLEAADVGSRELDAEIALALGTPQTFFGAAFGTAYVDGPDFVNGAASWAGGGRRYYAPDYTTSLDAISAVTREKLPDLKISIDQFDRSGLWTARFHRKPQFAGYLVYGDGADECLARCITFLRAWKETR